MTKIGFLSADIRSLFQIYLILTSQIQPIGYDLTGESFSWPEFDDWTQKYKNIRKVIDLHFYRPEVPIRNLKWSLIC